MMELCRVLGNTFVAEGATALMPVYKLNDRDVILIDTGYARLDRSGLTHLLEEKDLCLKGVICSHAHFDHTGNARFLQETYRVPVACPLIEAGISVNPDSYRANYVALTYGKSQELFLEECFTADVIISPDAHALDFCGVHFGILQLPGHSAGQIGIVTPDNVAYLGDCLISEEEISKAKLPTSMFIAKDLKSKASLRDLQCERYIIAHKNVYEDIRSLIDANIAFIISKRDELLEVLSDGMSFSEWIYAFCQRENVRTHNELKYSIVERNFSNFVAWLTDSGEIEVRREFCAKKYYHATCEVN